MTLCSKCTKQIKPSDIKTCSKCGTVYHYFCLNISSENFVKESKAYKATWRCSECKLKEKEKRGELNSTLPPPKSPEIYFDAPTPCSTNDLKQYIEKKLEETLSRLLREINRKFTAESADTRSVIQELTESVKFMSAKNEELQVTVENNSKLISDLQAVNSTLRVQVSDLKTRLDHYEQQSRECNIEIQCVPEHNSENIKTIVRQLTATVGDPLSDNELINYHRVAKINSESKRPRSIVLKLPSPLVRDSILAAVKTFNRTNQNDKLNSSHLGIAGQKCPIYVCEHLSPANKQLHAAARRAAKDKKFQFVWVRNGKIFMRRDVSSKGLLIKDLESLNTL